MDHLSYAGPRFAWMHTLGFMAAIMTAIGGCSGTTTDGTTASTQALTTTTDLTAAEACLTTYVACIP